MPSTNVPTSFFSEKNLSRYFADNGRVMPLSTADGVTDGFYVADALARGLRFKDQKTAMAIASAMVHVNAGMSYLEVDPKHPYNRNFLHAFMKAMKEIDAVAKAAGIHTVILPHDFTYFAGKDRREIREHVAKFGIQPAMTLPSGVEVRFRDAPYDLNLKAFGKIRWNDNLFIRDESQPNGYRMDINPSVLLGPGCRGYVSATRHAKDAWDRNDEGETPQKRPVQLSLGLGDPNAKKTGGMDDVYAGIRARIDNEAAHLGFLKGGPIVA